MEGARGTDGIERLTDILMYLRKEVSPDLSPSILLGFLLICGKEGITQTEVCERLKLTSGAVSRMYKLLGRFQVKEKGPNGETTKVTKGLGLIHIGNDLYERRRTAAWLTERGKEVRDEINRRMFT